MQLRRGKKQFLVLVVLLIMVMIAATVVFALTGNSELTQAVSMSGTALVLMGCMVYVVFFDSKRRWPDANARERFAKVMTFQR